jgi:hypothetical protein
MNNHTSTIVHFKKSCDFCEQEGHKVPAVIDGRTDFQSWAYMCEQHFSIYGVGLGLGKGQRLVYKE